MFESNKRAKDSSISVRRISWVPPISPVTGVRLSGYKANERGSYSQR